MNAETLRGALMSIELNHTIVHASDRDATATFLTEILGLPEAAGVRTVPGRRARQRRQPRRRPRRRVVPVRSTTRSWWARTSSTSILGRIKDRGLTYWADPFHRQEGRVNHNDGGSGVYWEDPDGHNLEIITVPYGGA